MKKLTALTLALLALLAFLFPCSAEVAVLRTDVTYRLLYERMLSVLNTAGDPDHELLHADTATVWEQNPNTAGFLFSGDGWSVRGESDMETGIITRLICRLPYKKPGILMAHAVLFTLSSETDPARFLDQYVPENALLNGEPFPDYTNTLDAGSLNDIVFEFTRTTPCSLLDSSDACDMSELIRLMQAGS